MTRDLSEKQFIKRIEQRGMKLQQFLGYVDIGNGVHVSRFNAGDRRRTQLAYLIAEQRKWDAKKSTGAMNHE